MINTTLSRSHSYSKLFDHAKAPPFYFIWSCRTEVTPLVVPTHRNVSDPVFTTNLFEKQPLLELVDHLFGDLLVQISTPEHAILETLYLVPHGQSIAKGASVAIEEVCLLMEGLASLSPQLDFSSIQ
jgi:Transcriptional regulator, AbiEi antitoxin, Type IV TA system